MEEEAEQLIMENIEKNFIDYEEYPQSAEIQNRCVHIIARLFHAPTSEGEEAIGCSTIGSSEAIILSLLAMKKRWQRMRREAGLDADRPNMVMGANVQVCWKKAARYLDIEERYTYCSTDCYTIVPSEAVSLCDERTIGIAAILGSTYTGHYDDVQALNEGLEQLCARTGWDIGIHVDAASGGFVVPFSRPDLIWDFRLSRVISINVSGHKYGFTYPGIGWNIWRSSEYLEPELVFHVDYLGADQATYTLNFSKSASMIIAQYYVLIRLGRKGFVAIIDNLIKIADYLANGIESSGKFILRSARHGNGLPLVAFTLKEKTFFQEMDIAARLRERGWIVPAYHMAPKVEDMQLLRVVIREDFSMHKAESFIRDLLHVLEVLSAMDHSSILAQRHATASRWTLLRNTTKAIGICAPRRNVMTESIC